MSDNHNQKERDYQNKIRALEKEVKILQDRLEAENRGSALVNLLERKVQESHDNEQRLAFELEQTKNEKERKFLEQQETIERERESYKKRIQDLETKVKDLDYARQTNTFEMEKERAWWTLEKERFTAVINEQKEDL